VSSQRRASADAFFKHMELQSTLVGAWGTVASFFLCRAACARAVLLHFSRTDRQTKCKQWQCEALSGLLIAARCAHAPPS